MALISMNTEAHDHLPPHIYTQLKMKTNILKIELEAGELKRV